MTGTDAWRWKERYAPKDLEAVTCLLCGGDDTSHIAAEFSLNIVRCRKCSLIYVNPRPRDSEKNYWAPARAEMEKKYAAIFEGRQPHDRDGLYINHLKTIAHYQPAGRFLDIGTHCGFFLRHTQGQGWEAEGLEPSPVLGELAREKFGLKITTGSLAEAAFPDESFDVITLLDVIEHLQNPQSLLVEVRRIIKPGGVFFVKTPNGTYNYLNTFSFGRYYAARDMIASMPAST